MVIGIRCMVSCILTNKGNDLNGHMHASSDDEREGFRDICIGITFDLLVDLAQEGVERPRCIHTYTEIRIYTQSITVIYAHTYKH